MVRAEALFETPAGKVWRKLGYTVVNVIEETLNGIIAEFTKPAEAALSSGI